MRLARLTAENSLVATSTSHLASSGQAGVARAEPAGIIPAICFDPNAPLEMDFQILDGVPVAQLQNIATLSSECAQVVQAYGQARGLWRNVPL